MDSSSLKSFSQDSLIAENLITVNAADGRHLAHGALPEPNRDFGTFPHDQIGISKSRKRPAASGNDVMSTGNVSSNAAVDSSASKTSFADNSLPPSPVGSGKSFSDFRTAIEEEATAVVHGLPWWVVIIAWILVVLIAISFSLLIILYTFEFGLDKSLSWIQSVCCSFFIGTFLEQPLKIIVVALVLALIFKKSEDIEFNKKDIIADQSVRSKVPMISALFF